MQHVLVKTPRPADLKCKAHSAVEGTQLQALGALQQLVQVQHMPQQHSSSSPAAIQCIRQRVVFGQTVGSETL
jgi:hypothetical protein